MRSPNLLLPCRELGNIMRVYRYCLSPNSEVFCYDLIERFDAEIGFPPPAADSLFLAGDPDASKNYLHPANSRQA